MVAGGHLVDHSPLLIVMGPDHRRGLPDAVLLSIFLDLECWRAPALI
jgi:hypothetical protein